MVDPVDAELLLDEQCGETGAVDEQVRFEPLTAFGQYGGDIAVIVHLDFGDAVEMVPDSLLRGYLGEHIREFERVDMKCEFQWLSERRAALRYWAEPHFAKYRLNRCRFSVWNRPVAHVPVERRTIDRFHPERVKRMVKMLAVAVQPVDMLDGLFERAVDSPEEVQGINADDGEEVIDVRQRGLAGVEARRIGRLDDADFHWPLAVVPEGRREILRRHPGGCAAANDQYFLRGQAVTSSCVCGRYG